MTFTELVTELQARGFSDLSTLRAGRYVNAARAELDRLYLWPWREKSVTGNPPLSITDLGPIEAVLLTATDTPLRGFQYRDLLNAYEDLSITGTPFAYYTASPSGTPVVATYPETDDDIGVQYWKVTVDISGTTVPASPREADLLIVDMAVCRAYRDRDNHDAATALQAEVDRQLRALLDQYPPGIADDPGIYIGPGWDLT